MARGAADRAGFSVDQFVGQDAGLSVQVLVLQRLPQRFGGIVLGFLIDEVVQQLFQGLLPGAVSVQSCLEIVQYFAPLFRRVSRVGPFGLFFRGGKQVGPLRFEDDLTFLFRALQFGLLSKLGRFLIKVFQECGKRILLFIEFLVLAELFRLERDPGTEFFPLLRPRFAVLGFECGFAVAKHFDSRFQRREHTGQFPGLFQKSFIGPLLFLQLAKGLVQFLFFALRVFQRFLAFPDLFLQKREKLLGTGLCGLRIEGFAFSEIDRLHDVVEVPA